MSDEDDLKDLERQYAKKVAAAVGKAKLKNDDLNLIDDKKLLSRPYWIQ